MQPRSKQFENDEMPLPPEAWDADLRNSRETNGFELFRLCAQTCAASAWRFLARGLILCTFFLDNRETLLLI